MVGVAPEELDRAVRAIVEAVQPDRIILFGSCGRGEARPASDLDLLVVMPMGGQRRGAHIRIGLALRWLGVPVDVLVATPEEMTRFGSIPGSLAYPAARDGRVLCERR
jgi:predicted nucleotidyltransferase